LVWQRLKKQSVGICQVSKFAAQDELKAGRSVELLLNHASHVHQFFLLYRQNGHLLSQLGRVLMILGCLKRSKNAEQLAILSGFCCNYVK
jgi:hypothetical protein